MGFLELLGGDNGYVMTRMWNHINAFRPRSLHLKPALFLCLRLYTLLAIFLKNPSGPTTQNAALCRTPAQGHCAGVTAFQVLRQRLSILTQGSHTDSQRIVQGRGMTCLASPARLREQKILAGFAGRISLQRLSFWVHLWGGLSGSHLQRARETNVQTLQ